ncbi:MAG: cytochrome-c peroxidase [Leptospiraceae bacterium]|nr:cytochrome-c peroxidase [Leptospiraceae bacterium]MCK6381979.1 cytochrome-c peroxidase [Leptospiraceae bacterium]
MKIQAKTLNIINLIIFLCFLFFVFQACKDRPKNLTSENCPSHSIQVTEVTLKSECPTSFLKKADGNCYYNFPYKNSNDSYSGLRKQIPIKKDGLSPKKIDLGRILFFDPILSGDNSISCAHCHHPAFGLSDGRDLSMGTGGCGLGPNRAGGKIISRSSPSIWNVAFYDLLFWDGRAATLEDQALGPLFSPIEMNANKDDLKKKINSNPVYEKLFREVYGKEYQGKITVQHIAGALADFERTLISMNSKYDKFVWGEKKAINEEELKGFNIYRSFLTRCSECHPPPLFTTNETAIIGAPDHKNLQFDKGRENLTGQSALKGDFKIPGLRNIALTSPYMHSGAILTLDEIVNFYNKGGGRESHSYGELDINWHVREIGLREDEKKALVLFLHTLTDETNLPSIPDKVPSGLPVPKGTNNITSNQIQKRNSK